MRTVLPFKIEVKGKASSSWDEQTIERRLAILRERHDQAAIEEIAFLENLKREPSTK